jgi:hypothetical protein
MKKYRLLGPAGFYDSPTRGLLAGHKGLKIYGRLDCPNALRHLAEGKYKRHRVFFADEASALACGFRPCYYCSREAYRMWKAGQPGGD